MMPGAAARWSSSPCPGAPPKGEREKRVDYLRPRSGGAQQSAPQRGPIPIRRSGGSSTCSCPTGANWSSLATQPEPDQHSLLAQLGWGLPKQARPRTAQNPPSQCRTDLLHPPIESTEISLADPPQSERPARERSSTQPGSPRHEGATDGEASRLLARMARLVAADRSRFSTLIRREPRHQVSAPPPARTVSI